MYLRVQLVSFQCPVCGLVLSECPVTAAPTMHTPQAKSMATALGQGHLVVASSVEALSAPAAVPGLVRWLVVCSHESQPRARSAPVALEVKRDGPLVRLVAAGAAQSGPAPDLPRSSAGSRRAVDVYVSLGRGAFRATAATAPGTGTSCSGAGAGTCSMMTSRSNGVGRDGGP